VSCRPANLVAETRPWGPLSYCQLSLRCSSATAYHVGQFNVWGTITAVVTLGAGVAGLNLLGLPSWVEPAFNGTALLVAVTATRYLRGAPL
jgi:hypothetical protein